MEVIIWYKHLLLFHWVFLECFGKNFNDNFFRYRSWFEDFFICRLVMEVRFFESTERTHYTCYWGPFESKVHKHFSRC